MSGVSGVASIQRIEHTLARLTRCPTPIQVRGRPSPQVRVAARAACLKEEEGKGGEEERVASLPASNLVLPHRSRGPMVGRTTGKYATTVPPWLAKR